ncbi:MAG TPA: segregation/condensation protein A, partial [Gaiellales bacterium]|nr:segregation/condensation protein A [Gaiellales bacterium]
MTVSDLELDLDVFQGPFDLLLALVMREEIELAEVPIADIVVAFVERMRERGEIDLESASEFLVLIAALLEIKVRMLFPGEEDDESDGMSAEEAEAELLARLIEYKRYAAAASWLAVAAASEPRVFRAGPAPLAPRPEPVVDEFSEDPWQLQTAIGRLLQPPPEIDLSAVRRRLVPVSEFLSRFRAVLRERRAFSFDEAVAGLDRLS